MPIYYRNFVIFDPKKQLNDHKFIIGLKKNFNQIKRLIKAEKYLKYENMKIHNQ